MIPPRSTNRSSSAFEVRLFGPFTVLRDGQELPALRTRKGQSLLALLVLRGGRGVERPWLAGTLWPDSAESQARYNLRRSLSDLRQALGSEADRVHSGGQPQTLAFDLRGAVVDVLAFDAAIARGDMASLQAAAALHQAPLLEGCLEEWVLPEREARERLLADALEALARDAATKGDTPAAERYLRRAIHLDPFRETAQRALMQTLADAGTPAAALQCFRDLRLLLEQELGAEPGPETIALYRQIRDDVRRLLQRSPPRSALPRSPAPRHIPYPRTTFLGREREIEAIVERVRRTRLLTLTGAGGVGKTRIAIRLAQDVGAEYDDVRFVDLAPLAEGELVPREVATALGVGVEPKRALVDTMCDVVADRELLVILDNCEHLAAACATLADTMLRRCPNLRLCATSRQALGVEGESVYRVSSLSLPRDGRSMRDELDRADGIDRSDAVRLFIERARESSPGFTMTAANANLVAEICVHLDGIPLAIELAAARLRVLSVEQIAARLDDRFQLLTGGSRHALPRHQTLRATLDWSHDLLDAREQAFFRRLSCFTGGATLEAIESVCTGGEIRPEDALDLLATLFDRSLVDLVTGTDGNNRYDLLETIRQYGREHLARSGEGVTLSDRHATFFVQFAAAAEPHLSGPEQGVWLKRLEAEHNNMRAALTFLVADDPGRALSLALALGAFWETRAHFAEGRAWLQRALNGAFDAAPSSRARALAIVGRLAWFQEDYPNARAPLEQCLEIFESIGDRRSGVGALGSLAQVAVADGDYVRARALCERAVMEARALGDKQLLASQLRDYGTVAGAMFDLATARALDEEALDLCRDAGDRRGVARALMGLGLADAHSGEPQRAKDRLLESLQISRDVGDDWITCGAAFGLGQALKALDDRGAAHANYSESLTLCRKANTNFAGPLLEAFAALAATEGQALRTARLLGASEAFHEARQFRMLPYLQPEHDRAVAMAHAALGPQAFTTAWAEGRAMDFDRATELALTRDEQQPVRR